MKLLKNGKPVKTHTPRDLIVAWLQDPTGTAVLPPKLQDEYNRWDACDNLIRQYPMKQVEQMMMKRFDISKSTVKRDIANAQFVFASTNRINKEYWRSRLFEYAQEIYFLARADQDWRSANAAVKNMIDILPPEEKDKIPWAEIQQHNYYMLFNTSTEELDKKKLKALKLNDIDNMDPESRQLLMDHVSEAMLPTDIDDILKSDANASANNPR